MAENVELCVICAWRGVCNKKFSISGRSLHCPDFTKDVAFMSDQEKDELMHPAHMAHSADTGGGKTGHSAY